MDVGISVAIRGLVITSILLGLHDDRSARQQPLAGRSATSADQFDLAESPGAHPCTDAQCQGTPLS
jgi:hypothetical protein